MGTRKQFSRALYEAYDAPAKNKLVEYLKSAGHSIENTEENYHVDIVSTKNNYTYFNEAEVKLAWKEEWPTDWEEIRIPERKTRLLKKYSGNVNFYVFNNDLSACWFIKGSQMTADRIKEAKGRYILKGEKFYHIPYQEAELIEL